jgi:O-antigen/teichoic acid export membrane protein
LKATLYKLTSFGMAKASTLKQTVVGDNERSVRAFKNILYSFFIKGYSILIQFALVPLTLNYLDAFYYGIWLTLASMVEWFNFFDIGIGHGLRNKLAEALAKGDFDLSKTYVSTAYALVTTIFTSFILLFTVVNPFLNWSVILNVSPALGSQLGEMVFYVFIFFCLRFIFNLISVVLFANQSPAINNLMGPLGSTLAFLGIYALMHFVSNSLFWVAVILSSAPLVILVLFNLILFNTKYKAISPSIKSVNFSFSKDLLGLGFQFFIIQMSLLVVFSTSNIILTQLFGPEEVTVYNIAYRYFTIGIMVNGIITFTYWSPFTEAFVKKDFTWIRKSLAKLNNIALAISAMVIVSAVLADQVIYLWVGDSVTVPDSIKIALGVYAVINLLSAPYNMFINGAGKIRLQLYMAILSIVATIPLAIFFSKTLAMGPAGVVVAMVCSTLPNAILYRIQSKKILDGTAAGIWNR